MLLQWAVPEYRQYERSRRWYWLAGIALIALLAYSLLTANYLFTLLVIIASVIVVLQDRESAPDVDFVIAENGIALGRDWYAYDRFLNFWIYYEPDEAKTLFFEFKTKIRPRLSIPLFNKNPLHVRSTLLKFLTEDTAKENEPMSEQLSRLLKL